MPGHLTSSLISKKKNLSSSLGIVYLNENIRSCTSTALTTWAELSWSWILLQGVVHFNLYWNSYVCKACYPHRLLSVQNSWVQTTWDTCTHPVLNPLAWHHQSQCIWGHVRPLPPVSCKSSLKVVCRKWSCMFKWYHWGGVFHGTFKVSLLVVPVKATSVAYSVVK
jgi:hypothetical protein